jgi:hypothetical protein
MKSFLIILLFVPLSSKLYSQELSQPVFIGTWKAVKAQFIPEMSMDLDVEGQKKLKQMQEGLIGTLFTFKENNDFAIKFPGNVPVFMKELEILRNKKWKMGKDQRIAIGSEKDNYSMIGITVLIQQGKKIIILDESPFMLEVVRL